MLLAMLADGARSEEAMGVLYQRLARGEPRIDTVAVLRPCLECGYRCEPREGAACPECGTAQPPASWVIVETTIPPHVRRWFYLAIGIGIGLPMTMIGVSLLFGTSTLGPGCIGLFPILFTPFLVRQLFSRKALGIYVIRDDGVATTSLGFNRVCRSAEGWRAGALVRDAVDPHRWALTVHRYSEGIGEGVADRFEIPIDDRIDDPVAVEAALRRALAPPVAA